MSELTTSILLIGTESALVMLVLAGVIIFFRSRRSRQDKGKALELVARVNKDSKEKLDNLKIVLQETYGLDEEAAVEKADDLIKTEKKLYVKMLRVHMGHDRNAIASIDKDVKALIDNYRNLVEGEPGGSEEETEKRATPTILRGENKALRLAKAQLEADLAAAMETMENMMTEYATMYEGNRQDGEQRVKNEMFKLHQKLENRVEVDDLDDGIPEIGDMIEPEEFK